jgi:CRP-like cAMP-binding protein
MEYALPGVNSMFSSRMTTSATAGSQLARWRDVNTDRKGVGGMLRCFRKTRKLTHKELAAWIGSSREAVSNCLKVLSGKGIVKESEGSILIAHNALERLKHNEKT